jgi:hypothetical protein
MKNRIEEQNELKKSRMEKMRRCRAELKQCRMIEQS